MKEEARAVRSFLCHPANTHSLPAVRASRRREDRAPRPNPPLIGVSSRAQDPVRSAGSRGELVGITAWRANSSQSASQRARATVSTAASGALISAINPINKTRRSSAKTTASHFTVNVDVSYHPHLHVFLFVAN